MGLEGSGTAHAGRTVHQVRVGQPSTGRQEAVSSLFQEVCEQDQKLEEPPGPLSSLLEEPLTNHPLSKEPQKPPLLLPRDHHDGCVASATPAPHLTCLFCDTGVGELRRCFPSIFCSQHHTRTAFMLDIHNDFLLKQKHEKFQTN